MKKIMAFSMAAVMALSMAGCGSKPAADTAAATEAQADTTAAKAEDTAAAGTDAAAPAAGKKYVIQPLPRLSLRMTRARWWGLTWIS